MGRCGCSSATDCGCYFSSSGDIVPTGSGSLANPMVLAMAPGKHPTVTATSGTRPGSPGAGQAIYETNTDLWRYADGAGGWPLLQNLKFFGFNGYSAFGPIANIDQLLLHVGMIPPNFRSDGNGEIQIDTNFPGQLVGALFHAFPHRAGNGVMYDWHVSGYTGSGSFDNGFKVRATDQNGLGVASMPAVLGAYIAFGY